MDNFNKKIDLVAEYGISGNYVVRLFQRAAHFRGMPSVIQDDQEPEFAAQVLD